MKTYENIKVSRAYPGGSPWVYPGIRTVFVGFPWLSYSSFFFNLVSLLFQPATLATLYTVLIFSFYNVCVYVYRYKDSRGTKGGPRVSIYVYVHMYRKITNK